MRVALQPATLEGDVLQHYSDTIQQPVAFEQHADLLDPAVLARLRHLFPDKTARMWGVVPGDRDINVRKVARLRAGDFVLFYGKGRFYLAGTVALRWHDPELARRLWSIDRRPVPQTWEHMYAMTDVRRISIPIEEVRPLLGWGAKAVVMGFNIYEGEKAERLRDLCNLAPVEDAPLEAEDQPQGQMTSSDPSFDGPTDGTRESPVRREQLRFKKRLMELGEGRCALCGRTLLPGMLVGAHIKKRSKCTEEERRDFDNVGMLACLLGCDGLFERGYIAVGHGGELMVSAKVAQAPEVEAVVRDTLQGRRTSWWTEEREKYFEWHRTHTFLQLL